MATINNNSIRQGNARPDTVSDIFGLEVYTRSGVYLGTVEDVRLDFSQTSSTGVALTDVNPEVEEAAGGGEGVVIPYTWVDAVHDIVVTIDILERLRY